MIDVCDNCYSNKLHWPRQIDTPDWRRFPEAFTPLWAAKVYKNPQHCGPLFLASHGKQEFGSMALLNTFTGAQKTLKHISFEPNLKRP